MRRLLLTLLVLFGTLVSAKAEEFELSGIPFDLRVGGELLTRQSAKVALIPLEAKGLDGTAKAVRNQLQSSFKQEGVRFDGDAVELVFRLNGVTTFEELAVKEAPQSLDLQVENAEAVNVILDAQLKGELLETLTSTGNRLAASELQLLLPDDMKNDAAFIDEAYRAFAGIIDEGTKPLSSSLLRQLQSETSFLQSAASAAELSGAWPEDTLPVIRTIAEDNRGRLASLLEPLGPEAADLKGNNGTLRVEVSLLDFSTGQKIEKHGFRVRFRPLTRKQFDELPAFTSPAAGTVPEASLCFVAVDPNSGATVSDVFFGSLGVLTSTLPARIELSYNKLPGGNSRCIQ